MDAQNKLMRENILSRLERLEAVEDIRSLVSGYA